MLRMPPEIALIPVVKAPLTRLAPKTLLNIDPVLAAILDKLDTDF